MNQDRCNLPLYVCHKHVRAFKISSVERSEDSGAVLHPADGACVAIYVTDDFVKKHNPQPLGYFVRYEDGYESFSPAEAFEAGYTRMAEGDS